MKRIAIWLAIVLAVAVVPVGLASPAMAYTCQEKIDREGFTFNGKIGHMPPRDVYVNMTVQYRYCSPSAGDNYAFVEPKVVIGTYRIDLGSRGIDCGDSWFERVSMNWYFWHPYRGTNFNPGEKVISCDHSGMNTASQVFNLDNVPRLYYGPGYGNDRQPRWKVNVELHLNNWFNEFRAHSQDFKPFA